MKGRLLKLFSLILATSTACNSISVDTKQAQETPPPSIADILTPISEPPKEFKGFHVIEESQDPYRCVGQVFDNNDSFVGSAVQIDKNLVLTAGHCIDGTNLKFFRVDGEDYTIVKQIIHPKFKIGEIIIHDIGILILDRPTCIKDFPVITYDKKDLTRFEELTTVGFSHEVKKSSEHGSFFYFGLVLEDPFEFKFQSTTGAHVWFGDSGGAVFEDGGKLAGLISSFRIHDLKIVEMSATSLFLYKQWIEDTIKENKDILK
jgi:hypothetical protein